MSTTTPQPPAPAAAVVWGAVAVFAAAVVRLPLMFMPGHAGDKGYFVNWAKLFTQRPLEAAYLPGRFQPDHLPPDLIIHWGLASSFLSMGGKSFESTAYSLLLKALPTFTDLVMAVLAYVFLSAVRGRVTGVIGLSLVLLAPPMVLTSSLWGQWDSLAICLLAGTAFCAWRWPRVWGLFLPLSVYAVFIKPPLAVVVLPVIAAEFFRVPPPRRDETAPKGGRGSVVRFLINMTGGGAAGLALVAAVSAPFNVSLIKTPGSLYFLDLVKFAGDKFTFRAMNSPNFWGFLQHPKERVLDTRPLFLDLSASTWGMLMFVAAALLIGIIALARRRAPALDRPWVLGIWGATATTWASTFFLTRVHERYLLPCVVASLLLALLTQSRVAWAAFALAAVASTVCTVSGLLQANRMVMDHGAWIAGCVAYALTGALLLAFPFTKPRIAA
ncbi:hypothetical protein [Falsarthrobacter nasiphocae]|uniref:Uncharacterized protein n=1 Tax=Falsarthrobacter nasiphocae TaxID=189863 RepID=A0AAE3YF09_9MICC|nr:hypothetical protein [Falsarthrobacter nasiphocae]MDR6892623.1 hypothetical protein [Falsarthrobacter nasiphocae]